MRKALLLGLFLASFLAFADDGVPEPTPKKSHKAARYKCDRLLVQMAASEQRRANVIFINGLAHAMLAAPGLRPEPTWIKDLLAIPKNRWATRSFKLFEDAILAPYLESNPELQKDRALRRSFLAKALHLPEGAVEVLLFHYDLESVTNGGVTAQTSTEEIHRWFPIAPLNITPGRAFDDRLLFLRARSPANARRRHALGLADQTIATAGWGDPLWLRDIFNLRDRLRGLAADGIELGREGLLADWLVARAMPVQQLWGSFVERELLLRHPETRRIYPGSDIRVGAKRHADGWLCDFSADSGTPQLRVEAFFETKASGLATWQIADQLRTTIVRLLHDAETVELSNARWNPEQLLLRTRAGYLSLRDIRARWGARFFDATASGQAFLALYREVFPDDFYRVLVPAGEQSLEPVDGVTYEEGATDRSTILAKFARYLAHHVLDTDEDLVLTALQNRARVKLPSQLLQLLPLHHRDRRATPRVGEKVSIVPEEERLRAIDAFVDAMVRAGRGLKPSDIGTDGWPGTQDWYRLVGGTHWRPSSQRGHLRQFDGKQEALVALRKRAAPRGITIDFLHFTIQKEARNDEYAEFLKLDALDELRPLMRRLGRLPYARELKDTRLLYDSLTGLGKYAPGESLAAFRIYDSSEELALRAYEDSVEHGYSLRLGFTTFHNASETLQSILRRELIVDIARSVTANHKYPKGNLFGDGDLPISEAKAFRLDSALYATREDVALAVAEHLHAQGKPAYLVTMQHANPPEEWPFRAAMQDDFYRMMEPHLLEHGERALREDYIRPNVYSHWVRLVAIGTSRQGTVAYNNRVFDGSEAMRAFLRAKFEARFERPLAP